MRVVILLGLVGCGEAVVDLDGDGFGEAVDCDDADGAVYPGAVEVCDEVDNDCDTVLDNVRDGGDLFYPDVDGDGFGDAAAPLRACAAPSGAVGDATDCDDDDAAVHPGAPELCDDLDNDCDAATLGQGASFRGDGGTATDWTDDFSAGTAASPVELALEEPGTLHVCAGTWYVSLPVGENVTLVGHGRPTLSGGHVAPILVVDGAHRLTVSGVALADPGVASLAESEQAFYGGAIACARGAEVEATDIDILGGPTTPVAFAGGLVAAVAECSLSVSDALIAGGQGYLGGQVYAGQSDVTFADVTFIGGNATSGGAIFADGLATQYYGGAPTDLTCDRCAFEGNTADYYGAVVLNYAATLTMNGGSFFQNSARLSYGGAVMVDSGSNPNPTGAAILNDVFFAGNVGQGVASDVYGSIGATNLVYDGTAQTLMCTTNGCD